MPGICMHNSWAARVFPADLNWTICEYRRDPSKAMRSKASFSDAAPQEGRVARATNTKNAKAEIFILAKMHVCLVFCAFLFATFARFSVAEVCFDDDVLQRQTIMEQAGEFGLTATAEDVKEAVEEVTRQAVAQSDYKLVSCLMREMGMRAVAIRNRPGLHARSRQAINMRHWLGVIDSTENPFVLELLYALADSEVHIDKLRWLDTDEKGWYREDSLYWKIVNVENAKREDYLTPEFQLQTARLMTIYVSRRRFIDALVNHDVKIDAVDVSISNEVYKMAEHLHAIEEPFRNAYIYNLFGHFVERAEPYYNILIAMNENSSKDFIERMRRYTCRFVFRLTQNPSQLAAVQLPDSVVKLLGQCFEDHIQKYYDETGRFFVPLSRQMQIYMETHRPTAQADLKAYSVEVDNMIADKKYYSRGKMFLFFEAARNAPAAVPSLLLELARARPNERFWRLYFSLYHAVSKRLVSKDPFNMGLVLALINPVEMKSLDGMDQEVVVEFLRGLISEQKNLDPKIWTYVSALKVGPEAMYEALVSLFQTVPLSYKTSQLIMETSGIDSEQARIYLYKVAEELLGSPRFLLNYLVDFPFVHMVDEYPSLVPLLTQSVLSLDADSKEQFYRIIADHITKTGDSSLLYKLMKLDVPMDVLKSIASHVRLSFESAIDAFNLSSDSSYGQILAMEMWPEPETFNPQDIHRLVNMAAQDRNVLLRENIRQKISPVVIIRLRAVDFEKKVWLFENWPEAQEAWLFYLKESADLETIMKVLGIFRVRCTVLAQIYKLRSHIYSSSLETVRNIIAVQCPGSRHVHVKQSSLRELLDLKFITLTEAFIYSATNQRRRSEGLKPSDIGLYLQKYGLGKQNFQPVKLLVSLADYPKWFMPTRERLRLTRVEEDRLYELLSHHVNAHLYFPETSDSGDETPVADPVDIRDGVAEHVGPDAKTELTSDFQSQDSGSFEEEL